MAPYNSNHLRDSVWLVPVPWGTLGISSEIQWLIPVRQGLPHTVCQQFSALAGGGLHPAAAKTSAWEKAVCWLTQAGPPGTSVLAFQSVEAHAMLDHTNF